MTKVLIPRLRWLQMYGVPGSFVNHLLWIPDEGNPAMRSYVHLSDLDISDKMFKGILKK